MKTIETLSWKNSAVRSQYLVTFCLRCFVFGFFFLWNAVETHSQIMAPARIEFNSRIDVPVYDTQVLGEKGLLYFYETSETTDDGRRKWFFALFDTAFHEQWQQNVSVSDGYQLKMAKTEGSVAFFLFLSQGRNKRTEGFEVVRFDCDSNSFRLYGSTLPEKTTFAGFAALNNAVLLGINLPRNQADILLFDLQTHELRSLGHGLSGQIVIQSVAANPQRNEWMVGIKRFESGKYIEDVFQVYSASGNLLQSHSYSALPNFLHSYSITFDADGALVAVGSYDDEWTKRNAANATAEAEDWNFQSKGLFYLAFDTDQAKVAQFHPFGKFSNIYQAVSTDDLMRLRQKQSRNHRAQNPKGLYFQFFNPRLIKTADAIVFAGDAFKKQYRTETRMSYDFYGRLIPYTYTVFEGYNFFTGLYACFDKEGNLRWSSDLSLGETLLPYLKDITLAQADDDDFLTAFLRDGVLSYKVLDSSGKTIGQQEQHRVEPLFANDRLLEEEFSTIVHWYGPYFLLTGYQKITNIKLRADNVRQVFYMQKMAFK